MCGHCGAHISSNRGYSASAPLNFKAAMYICHACTRPTLFMDLGKSPEQVPGPPFGKTVSDVTDHDVAAIYEEARRATAAGAHSGAVMCCRKLLMHLAVAKGAPPGKTFKEYIDYLDANHYTPPGSKPWVDSIRNKGNDVNHSITISTRADAELLIGFAEMLLQLQYEFPAKLKPPPPSTP